MFKNVKPFLPTSKTANARSPLQLLKKNIYMPLQGWISLGLISFLSLEFLKALVNIGVPMLFFELFKNHVQFLMTTWYMLVLII